ncbi:unnamed protein product [Trifolium pratense]|uniref:Uncharacterized protein n=1 Tax=Trifolium pratense TaxID=57577 RepID=A0ACB0LTM8_TRIPR|nr:unnamed protein product [Trifolium pratense]
MDASPPPTLDEVERRFDERLTQMQLQRNTDMDEIRSLLRAQADHGSPTSAGRHGSNANEGVDLFQENTNAEVSCLENGFTFFTHDKSSTSMHLEELDDPQKFADEGVKVITWQEYVSRLHELKDEITRSWLRDGRVTSLKLL